ncbi:MAG: hypothetical protein HFI81_09625 [Eubacterium sp.]|nr:hypothetical protein [Eubacterium sp.]
MRKLKNRRSAMALLFAICMIAFVAMDAFSVKAASRPATVKNVKVVKTTEGTVKVKFKKVKWAEHYRVLIYQDDQPTKYPEALDTALVYAPKTKKTTYTIKHLTGQTNYTVKVLAYKNGQYSKMGKGAKCKTKGVKRLQIVCNECRARIPYYKGSDPNKSYRYYMGLHGDATAEFCSGYHFCGTMY